MKIGDGVIVQFLGAVVLAQGIIMEHYADRKYITIKTATGGEISGEYEAIQEVSLFK